jgi:hypothetical protein
VLWQHKAQTARYHQQAKGIHNRPAERTVEINRAGLLRGIV